MVDRQDGALRTVAQKSGGNRQDGRLRTVTQKEPSVAGFVHSFGVIIG